MKRLITLAILTIGMALTAGAQVTPVAGNTETQAGQAVVTPAQYYPRGPAYRRWERRAWLAHHPRWACAHGYRGYCRW